MRCAPRASNGSNHLGLCALMMASGFGKGDQGFFGASQEQTIGRHARATKSRH